jgi:hypothetical protein
MPHKGHPVTAENNPLDITEVECGFPIRSRMDIHGRRIVLDPVEKTAEETFAFLSL